MNIKDLMLGSLEASDSPSGTLNVLDFKKTLRGLIVAVLGAVITTGFDFLSNWLLSTDFGSYQILIGFVISSGIVEITRRYLAEQVTDLSQ